MSTIFTPKHLPKKSKKVNYLSPKVWRLTYLISLNSVYHNSEKKMYSRGSVVPSLFNGYEVSIYSGSRWSRKRINSWMIGYKLGEFTWNRKYAVYKKKNKKKKKNNWGLNMYYRYIEQRVFSTEVNFSTLTRH